MGSMYGLMCVGLTIIFGVMRVINFAQGEFMMLGVYFTYFCFAWFGTWVFFDGLWFPFVLVLLAGPAVFLFGIVMHRVLVNAMTGRKATQLEARGHYAQLVLTLGIALVLQNGGAVYFWLHACISCQ